MNLDLQAGIDARRSVTAHLEVFVVEESDLVLAIALADGHVRDDEQLLASLDGTPVEEDGVLHLRGPGFDLVLDDAQAARLAGHRGAQVTAGIRPASFHEGMEAAGSVDVIVVVSEYLGSTSILVTRCGEAEVLVELSSATPIRGGTPMKLGIASQDILLFDPMTGGAL